MVISLDLAKAKEVNVSSNFFRDDIILSLSFTKEDIILVCSLAKEEAISSRFVIVYLSNSSLVSSILTFNLSKSSCSVVLYSFKLSKFISLSLVLYSSKLLLKFLDNLSAFPTSLSNSVRKPS